MQHSIPKISEVNLELIDVHYYFDEEIEIEDIDISISVKASFDKNNSIIFFIHIMYILLDDEGEEISLFHTDYLAQSNIEDVDWSVSKNIEIEKKHLSHLLGMSFLMVRGAISSRLSTNFLAQVRLPVINPMELLDNFLKVKKDKFILTDELSGHGEEVIS